MSAETSRSVEPAYRSAPLVLVRGWLREGDGLEARVLERLLPDDRARYGAFTATDWLPLGFASRLYEEAAPLLCTNDPNPVRVLGRRLAGSLAQGVHRYFFRLLTVSFCATNGARAWPLFHRTGRAEVIQQSERALRMEVVDYPELTATLRATVSGYIAGLLDLTGARGVAVTAGGSPNRWVWTVTWGA